MCPRVCHNLLWHVRSYTASQAGDASVDVSVSKCALSPAACSSFMSLFLFWYHDSALIFNYHCRCVPTVEPTAETVSCVTALSAASDSKCVSRHPIIGTQPGARAVPQLFKPFTDLRGHLLFNFKLSMLLERNSAAVMYDYRHVHRALNAAHALLHLATL
jgi:hypothetical protein